MSGRGRHRRQINRRLSRGISRASLALTAGGAGIALPLIGAGHAEAASVSTWDKVAQCESSGNWSTDSGNGYSGGLQFSQSTWSGYGGTKYAPSADKASKDQQIAVAEKVLASQGPGAWPSCGPKAGLTQNSGSPQINPSGGSDDSGSHAGESASRHAQKPQAPSDRQPSGEKSYTVASGDTLAGIARVQHVEGGWQKLYDANKSTVGGNPDLIRPGQKLTLTGGGQQSGQQSGNTGGGQGGSASDASSSSSSYGNNLDGWIRQALDIMKAHGIPGSYEGIKRNIMRESAGNPNAVNNTDINAQNGTPSKGLLQTIQPTFDQYHVEGTANDMTDPVANIVAACNYAAAKYGSMDNVNGAY